MKQIITFLKGLTLLVIICIIIYIINVLTIKVYNISIFILVMLITILIGFLILTHELGKLIEDLE